MKVKDLIKKLKECNQNAKVSIVIGNEDNKILDTYDFEIHSKDIDEYIELFIYRDLDITYTTFEAIIKIFYKEV